VSIQQSSGGNLFRGILSGSYRNPAEKSSSGLLLQKNRYLNEKQGVENHALLYAF
jgi:hypothetical protein